MPETKGGGWKLDDSTLKVVYEKPTKKTTTEAPIKPKE